MEWLTGIAPIALIVLACPLMMWFMMRGMHGTGAGHSGMDGGHGQEGKVEVLEREVKDLRQQLAALPGGTTSDVSAVEPPSGWRNGAAATEDAAPRGAGRE